MRFGYAIIYVPDADAAITFYENVFGLKRRMFVESGEYGELETGQTALAFAVDFLSEKNLPDGYRKKKAGELPSGIEVALVTEDVAAAFLIGQLLPEPRSFKTRNEAVGTGCRIR